MKTIGIIYEITGNPYFNGKPNALDRISEYTYPSEINDICKAFEEIGYNFEVVDGAFDLLKREEELREKCHLFFNKSIGFKGLERKMGVPIIGKLFELPIIGSSAYSMTLARHKFHTNQLLKGIGFKTPVSYISYSNHEFPNIMSYPVIVKPNAESDSLGISDESICYSYEQVVQKVKELTSIFGSPIVIEEFIAGEEIKVAVLGNGENTKAAGCVRTLKMGKPIAGSIQTREDILNENISYCPVDDEDLKHKVESIAEEIHRSLEFNDYSRIDFRVNEAGDPFCIEVATHPEISKEGSSFIMASMQTHPTYPSVISAIIESGKIRLGL